MTSAADVLQDINMFFEAGLYAILSTRFLAQRSCLARWLLILFSWDPALVSEPYRRMAKVSAAPLGGHTGCGILPQYLPPHLQRSIHSWPRRQHLNDWSPLGGAVSHPAAKRSILPCIQLARIAAFTKKFGVSTALINRYTTTGSRPMILYLHWRPSWRAAPHRLSRKTRELCHAMEFAVGNLWIVQLLAQEVSKSGASSFTGKFH